MRTLNFNDSPRRSFADLTPEQEETWWDLQDMLSDLPPTDDELADMEDCDE